MANQKGPPMVVIVKEYKPEDIMVKMKIERALAKLKLGAKKDPNELLNKFASIKCLYSLKLNESRRKLRLCNWGKSILKHYCNYFNDLLQE